MVPEVITSLLIKDKVNEGNAYEVYSRLIGFKDGEELLLGTYSLFKINLGDKLDVFHEYTYLVNDEGRAWTITDLKSFLKISQISVSTIKHSIDSFDGLIEDIDPKKSGKYQVGYLTVSETDIQSLLGYSIESLCNISRVEIPPTKKQKNSANIADNSEVVANDSPSEISEINDITSDTTEVKGDENQPTPSPSGEVTEVD